MTHEWQLFLDDSDVVLAVQNGRYPTICSRNTFEISHTGNVPNKGKTFVQVRLEDLVLKTKLLPESYRDYLKWAANRKPSAVIPASLPSDDTARVTNQ